MKPAVCMKDYTPLYQQGRFHVLWKRIDNSIMEFCLISGQEMRCLLLDVSKENIRQQLATLLSRLPRQYFVSMESRNFIPQQKALNEKPLGPSTSSTLTIKELPLEKEVVKNIYKGALPLPWHKKENKAKSRLTYREQYKALFGEYPDFTCMQCFKHFSHKHNLQRHERTVHSPKVRHHCQICGAVYKHQFHFNDHMRVHENFVYDCVECQSGFESRNALKVHLKTCGKEDSNITSNDYKRIPRKPIIIVDRSKKSTGTIKIPIDFVVTM